MDPLAITAEAFAARADPELSPYIPRLPRLGLNDLTAARRTATLLGEGTVAVPDQERLVIYEREIPSDDQDRTVRDRREDVLDRMRRRRVQDVASGLVTG